MGEPVTLRKATERDVPAILALIRGIADYERLSHEVQATEALLREHGFGPRAVYECLLAEVDYDDARQAPVTAVGPRDARGIAGPVPRQAVGFALYFFTFSTFAGRPTLYLEDLFVIPSERRRGIGRTLLARLAQVAVERDCGRMEWSVLDWNTPARDLYFKIGARAMDEWTVFRMTPEAFGRLAREGLPGAGPTGAP